MSDIPRGALSRTARLASLPLSAAGRATLGLGQRLVGRDRDEISTELQRRTAEQVFEVLGTLKGGAMKFGQALSVYEAAIPDEYAAPYREALTKLQNAAPPMPPATVHRLMAQQFGTGWRSRFQRVRRHRRGRREHRPGAPRGLAGRPRGRGQTAVPRARMPRCGPTWTSCSGWRR